MNAFVDEHDDAVDTLVIDPEGEREQVDAARRVCAPSGTTAAQRGARALWSLRPGPTRT